jgi:hypothetical protein
MDYNCTLNIATFPAAFRKETNHSGYIGYSWGFLTRYDPVTETYSVFQSSPEERPRVNAVQYMSPQFLGNFYSKQFITITKDDVAKGKYVPYWIKWPHELTSWCIKLWLPEIHLENWKKRRDHVLESIVHYVRTIASGYDDDTTVYEIPDVIPVNDDDIVV